ncbi:MAG: hypothetical protein AAGG99_04050 [Pseudomonadota bacterium]
MDGADVERQVCRLGALERAIFERAHNTIRECAADDVRPGRGRCAFSNGVVRTLEDGAFKRAEAADLSFDIGAIDLQAQRATLITTRGQAPLRIVRAINANHFLEVVTEGFLNMTTIYAPITTGGRSPAVHSRHFGLLGQPVITQYTGFCDTLK